MMFTVKAIHQDDGEELAQCATLEAAVATALGEDPEADEALVIWTPDGRVLTPAEAMSKLEDEADVGPDDVTLQDPAMTMALLERGAA